MTRETILEKLRGSGHDQRKQDMNSMWHWYKFMNLQAESFDLWAFLKGRLSPTALDLVQNLTKYHPQDRWTLGQALGHDYFKEQDEGQEGEEDIEDPSGGCTIA